MSHKTNALFRWSLRIAAVAASGMLALAVAEGLLRLFPDLMPESALLRLQWSETRAANTISEPDPYLGFRYPSDTTLAIQRGELNFEFSTDEHGFRNQGPWPDSAGIVVVGDSQVFGYGVDDDEAWVHLVDEELSSIPVLNLGLIGASPQQYWRIYETLGAPTQPELVIFGLFPGNDLQGARQFSEWEEAGSSRNFDVWRFFGADAPGSERRAISRLQRSYLYQLIRETWRSFKVPTAGRTIELDDGSRIRLAPGLIHAATRTARPDHPDFQLVMKSIEKTRELAQSQGADFMVLLFPTKEEVYLPLQGEEAPQGIGAFLPELERQGISFLDLTPHFQQGVEDGNALFFEVDGHPNAEGNQLMADAVIEYLRAREEPLQRTDRNEEAPS